MTEEKDPKDEAQEKLAKEGIPLGLYRHYKGPSYKVFALSIDEGTLEALVHYHSLAHGTTWTRTVKNFTEEVEADGKKVPRFTHVEPGLGGRIFVWLKSHLTNSWMASNEFDAAMAHVGWACLITLATLVVTLAARAPFPRAALPACGWCSGALVVFALVKEYVYDANFEKPKQDFAENTRDVLGYLGGLALAWIVIGASMYIGR
jgi:hypothetical protein